MLNQKKGFVKKYFICIQINFLFYIYFLKLFELLYKTPLFVLFLTRFLDCSSILTLSVDKFPEYIKLLEAMNYPRDLSINTGLKGAGFTWDGKNNRQIPDDDDDEQRLDFIFALDKVPVLSSDWKNQHLRKIKSLDCKLIKLLDENGNDLSDHYGVEAVLDF